MSKVCRRSASAYSDSPVASGPPIDNAQIDSLKKPSCRRRQNILLSFSSLTQLLSPLELFDQSSMETDRDLRSNTKNVDVFVEFDQRWCSHHFHSCPQTFHRYLSTTFRLLYCDDLIMLLVNVIGCFRSISRFLESIRRTTFTWRQLRDLPLTLVRKTLMIGKVDRTVERLFVGFRSDRMEIRTDVQFDRENEGNHHRIEQGDALDSVFDVQLKICCNRKCNFDVIDCWMKEFITTDVSFSKWSDKFVFLSARWSIRRDRFSSWNRDKMLCHVHRHLSSSIIDEHWNSFSLTEWIDVQ